MPSQSLSSGHLGRQPSQPLPSGTPIFLLLSIILYGMEYPLGQFESAILALYLDKFLPTPSLLAGGCTEGKEEW